MLDKLELKGMAFICKLIDIAEWTFSLFKKPCSEKVAIKDTSSDDFDFTFNFDTCDNNY